MADMQLAVSRPVDLLQHAFESFDQAAATLQHSYRVLSERIEHLDLELDATNHALRAQLQANEDLRAHQAAVLESLTTGVIVADGADVIVQCNEAAERLLAASRADIVGERLATFLAALGLDAEQYPLYTAAGVPVALSHAVLRNGRGETGGRLVLIHDVSSVRRLEDRLQRRDRLAAMGEMVGRIAHEIRNPLGSIELFASMLRQDLRDEPTLHRYTTHISMAVESMDRLLSNLLYYTRPNRPRANWHAPELLVRDALTMASHATSRTGIEVRLDIEATAPMLWCDACQIKQVLVNLVLNAAHAMPDRGCITITGTADGPGVSAGTRLTVADTGVGIKPEDLSRIFDPFFTTREEGTGLGLAIAHAIVEGHGGRLEVESRLGVGSRFTIVLPAPSPAAGTSAAASGRPAQTRRRKEDR
jgi:signal transduction histidine kinase